MAIETFTKTYKGEDAFREDLARMLDSGWQVQSESMTEHRGAGKWIALGPAALATSKRRDYHVIYSREVEESPARAPKPNRRRVPRS